MKMLNKIGALAFAILAVGPAKADDAYPNQPIKIVLPYQAGSSPDATMRLIGQQLTQILKQPVIIENRPGAGGLIGGDALAKAKPDGYTLGYLSNQHLLHPYMVDKMPYDPLTAFRSVATLGRSAQVMLVPATSRASSIKEFIESAKAKGGSMKFGSGGIGSPAHLAGQIFAKQAGVNAVHVPYKGAPESVTALLGGHIDYVIATAGVAYPLVKAQKVKALAVTSDSRHEAFPNTPTLAESVPNGLVLEPWSILAVPAKTPQPVIDKLSRAFTQVLKDKRTVDYYHSLGADVMVKSPTETDEFYKAEAGRLANWATEIGLKN
jgi:tripartite-type tricarboxylate transporter receptor subunit TctC